MKSSFKSVAFFKQLIIFFLSKAQKGENTKKTKQVVTLFGPELHKCAFTLMCHTWSIAALQAIQSS